MRLFISLLFLLAIPAFAHDHKRPELNEWLSGLRNDQGQQCCTGPGAPGEAEEVEWKADGGKYSVKLGGEWVDVPPEKVLKGPNYAGTAKVWWYRQWQLNGQGSYQVRCFMPGVLS